MTTFPQPPEHLLTITEYAALGETEPGYTELVEGRLQMSPSPAPDHNFAAGALFVQLRGQVTSPSVASTPMRASHTTG